MEQDSIRDERGVSSLRKGAKSLIYFFLSPLFYLGSRVAKRSNLRGEALTVLEKAAQPEVDEDDLRNVLIGTSQEQVLGLD